MYDYKIDSEKIHIMDEQLEAVAAALIEDACLGDSDAGTSRMFVQSVMTDLRRWDAGKVTPPEEITLAIDLISKAYHLISDHLILTAADADELGKMVDNVLQILEEAEREALSIALA